MKIFNLWSVSVLLITNFGYISSANASLIGRDLDGNTSTVEAYYDDDLGISWLADANFAQTMGHTTISGTGRMSWDDANTWAAGLNINGFTGWRLPTTMQPDPNCSVQSDHLPPGGNGVIDTSWGFGCTGSELGHMFYNELSGSDGSPISTSGDPDLANFTNLKTIYHYWTDTEYAPDTNFAWALTFNSGVQEGKNKLGDSSQGNYAWAVHDGMIGNAVVPVPAAAWLFGSGMIGLIAVARRKVNGKSGGSIPIYN